MHTPTRRRIRLEVSLTVDAAESADWWAGWVMGVMEMPLMGYNCAEVQNVRVLDDPDPA